MADKKQPVGTIRILGASTCRESKNAAFASILCQDEAGNVWHFEASCMSFDLKEGFPAAPSAVSARGDANGG